MKKIFMINRKKLLYKLGIFSSTNKWLVLGLCTLVTFAFLVVVVTKWNINLGMLSLIDQDDPEVKKVNYANENFGGMDYTFIAVSANTLSSAKAYSDGLAKRFRKSSFVLRVVHKIDTDALMKYGFLFLEKDQINDFLKFTRENQPELIKMFANVHAAPFLFSFNRILEKEILEEDEIGDPDDALDRLDAFERFLDTTEVYLEKGESLGAYMLKKSLRDLFLQSPADNEDSVNDEYMVSVDKKSVLMLVMPSEAGDDLVFTSQMMAELESICDQVGENFAGSTYDIAGNVAVMRDEHQAILRDTKLSTAVTFILVLLIFYYFFRKFSDLFLIGVCLVTGVIWTYAATFLYIGFLGVTTAFFSAILLGLGIDFAIHILARYSEFRKQGTPVEEAIAEGIAGAGPGIITGALTTAAAFYVLMICRFKGISQLGFVAGTGVVSMLIIMFTLLPAMIAFRDGGKKGVFKQKEMADLTFLSTLANKMIKHRIAASIIILLFTIITAVAAMKIRFNYDFRSLEPRRGKAVAANHKLEKDFEKSLDYGLLFVDSVEQSRFLAKKLKTKSSVAQVNDISQYIPTGQKEKSPLIRRIMPFLDPLVVNKAPRDSFPMGKEEILGLATAIEDSRKMILAVYQLAVVGGNFDIEDKSKQVMAKADELASKIKRAPTAFLNGGGYYQYTLGKELQSLLSNLKQAAKGQELDKDKLPDVIKENFIGKDGRFLIYAYPGGYIWTKDMMSRIRDDLRSVTENSTSIGIVFLDLVDKIKLDFRFAVWISLAVVFLLVYVDFRKFITAAMALVPLVLGATWMVGAMVLTGGIFHRINSVAGYELIPEAYRLGLMFNLVNVAVVPLIIGIGIDNGVHIIHRYKSEEKEKIQMAVQNTGRAIFLSSITTMAGFGSLGLASYIAIASLGWVLVMGIIFCLLTSVVVLPILLSLLEKKIGDI